MLAQLEIQNIALIDYASIELGEGLNVLTGETGAGKSILIDAISAILGDRVSKELIRTGEEKAVVEAVFKVDADRLSDLFENFGIMPEEDGTLILSREFNVHGKNICRANGKMVTVSMLKEIGQRIIDIHGQHDNQSLLRTESHIELLDSFGGKLIQNLKQEYERVLSEYKSIKERLKELSGDVGERERKIDLLKYQINEIKKSKLNVGEDEELYKQRQLLSNAGKIMESLSAAYDMLYACTGIKSSAVDIINQALSELNEIVHLDEKYAGIARRLEEITYLLDDVVEEVRKERDRAEYNPDLLEQIEERIDLIQKLKKKYGNTIEGIHEYCKKIEQELECILRSEELVNDLQKQLGKTAEHLFRIAERLSAERKKAAEVLESKISNELDDLEMKRAQFKVYIEFDDSVCPPDEKKFAHNGLDKVEFLISANAGEPLKPLSKIASGGEMSRIMLAIKNILANVDKMPTLIFDEIDIGISGSAAQKVGEKLSSISKSHQVICVTHLAQIACMADSHYLIEKISNVDSTFTKVYRLEDKAINDEIARMLGGKSISDTTLRYAGEMLQNAQKFKKALAQN